MLHNMKEGSESPPFSSVTYGILQAITGIFQARMAEWGSHSFSRGTQPASGNCLSALQVIE